MITRTLGKKDGIILVKGTGTWSRTDVHCHYEALRTIIKGLRRSGKPIRILSDVSSSSRQCADVEDYIKQEMCRTYRPGDRVAILTGGASDQAYIRERLGGADIAAFKSRVAAEIWLVSEISVPARMQPYPPTSAAFIQSLTADRADYA